MPKPASFDKQHDNGTPQAATDRSEPDVELLVAYLDGELDAQEVRQMEDRLSVEPDLREKMASLEQTWNMLDQLETVPIDKELVRSTMEVVTLTIEKELVEGEKQHEKRKLHDHLVVLAILFMFAVIGYQLAILAGISRSREILEDIPIIQRMSMYKEIDDLKFLKMLSEEGVFDVLEDGALPVEETGFDVQPPSTGDAPDDNSALSDKDVPNAENSPSTGEGGRP
jgi:hypothetical protein